MCLVDRLFPHSVARQDVAQDIEYSTSPLRGMDKTGFAHGAPEASNAKLLVKSPTQRITKSP